MAGSKNGVADHFVFDFARKYLQCDSDVRYCYFASWGRTLFSKGQVGGGGEELSETVSSGPSTPRKKET